ncbi:MAG: glycosyltransferase family 1 protein [Cyanobacteria bacterium P01_F01_bin.150]
MRVAILRRAPKASVSMDVYADRLVQGLKTVRPNWIITEYYPQFPSRSFAPSKMLAGIQKYYERYWRYPNRLKRVDADIFHIIDHTDGDLSRWLGRSHNATVVTCHDLINLIKPETFKGRAKFPLISMTAWRWGVESMRQADHVITVSTHTKQDVAEHLQIASTAITVVPNAVDKGFHRLSAEAIQTVRDRYGLTPKTFCLLNVGSNNARKNISGILAAIAMARHQGLPVHFWKAGVDFTDEQTQFIQTNDLADCVKYVGKPNEPALIELYNAADCLIAPSLYEGFGLTILEAMACGTPVITATTSAMPEVAGDAAILVDPTDQAAIANAIQQLYTYPEQRQMLVQKGLERVQQFTWENTAQAVASVYEQTLAAQSPSTQPASVFEMPSQSDSPSPSISSGDRA